MRKWVFNISAVVFSIGLISAVASSTEPKFPYEIEAAGTGEILEGNEVKGRENAILDAVSKALVEYLSEGLGEEVMREYASRIDKKIVPEAEDLMQNFLVLSEDSTGERFSVLLSVKFNEELVENLLRESGIPLDSGGDAHVYQPHTMDSSRVRLFSVVYEGNGALADSLMLERYLSENVSDVESVRISRLAESRVAFEIAFQGDLLELAGKLATGWAPFTVESAFDGENTIRIRQSVD